MPARGSLAIPYVLCAKTLALRLFRMSERGIAVRQGLRFLRQQLPQILAKRIDVLSPRMIRIVEDLSGDWRRLDERIEQVTEEIEMLARESESCRQLMTVPGIGPLIASAMVAAIATGAAFTKGRDFADSFGPRLTTAAKGLHHNVLAVHAMRANLLASAVANWLA
jgi:transposase